MSHWHYQLMSWESKKYGIVSYFYNYDGIICCAWLVTQVKKLVPERKIW